MIKFPLYTDPKTGDQIQPVATILTNELLVNIQKRVLIFGSVGMKNNDGKKSIFLHGTFIKPCDVEEIQKIIVEECINLGYLSKKHEPMINYIPFYTRSRKTISINYNKVINRETNEREPAIKDVLLICDSCGISII